MPQKSGGLNKKSSKNNGNFVTGQNKVRLRYWNPKVDIRILTMEPFDQNLTNFGNSQVWIWGLIPPYGSFFGQWDNDHWFVHNIYFEDYKSWAGSTSPNNTQSQVRFPGEANFHLFIKYSQKINYIPWKGRVRKETRKVQKTKARKVKQRHKIHLRILKGISNINLIKVAPYFYKMSQECGASMKNLSANNGNFTTGQNEVKFRCQDSDSNCIISI